MEARARRASSVQPRKDRSNGEKEKQSDAVYRIIDVVGVSEKSWEDAGRAAVQTAADSLRDLRVAEVTKMDMKVEDGKVTAFRTRVRCHSSTRFDRIAAQAASAVSTSFTQYEVP